MKPQVKVEPTGTGTEDSSTEIEDDEGFTYVMNRKKRRQVLKNLVVKMEELNQSDSNPDLMHDSEGEIVFHCKNKCI